MNNFNTANMATLTSPNELPDWKMIDLSHEEIMRTLTQPPQEHKIDKEYHLTCLVITDEATIEFTSIIGTVEAASIADNIYTTYGPQHDDKWTESSNSESLSTIHENNPEMLHENLELSSTFNQLEQGKNPEILHENLELSSLENICSTTHEEPSEMFHEQLDLNYGEVSENLRIKLLDRLNECIFSTIDTSQYTNFRDFGLVYLGKALQVKPQKLTHLSLSGNLVTSELLIEFLKYLPESGICSLSLPEVVKQIPSHLRDNSDNDTDSLDDDNYGGRRIPWLKHLTANDDDDDISNNNRGCLNMMYKLCCVCKRNTIINTSSSGISLIIYESENDDNDSWLQYLATILKDTKMKSLDFYGNFIDNAINLEVLSSSLVGTQISSLGLRGCKILDDGLKCLASVLKATELACLDLSSTALDCKRLKMIVNGLEGTSVTTLNLSSNKIGVEGLKCLGGVLKNTSITAIDLSENKLNYDCVEVFAPYLVGSNITSLNLSSNKVGDDGVNCLANILTNQDTYIESIDLGFNFLFDLQTVADCLPNTRITSLCLKGNYQSNFQRSTVFEYFSKKLTKITSINLSKCNLSCDDLKLFSSGLADSNNTSLKSLILSQNEIDPDGIRTLVEILKTHEITHLDISYSCGKQTCSQLLACLNQTSVESLNFEGNEMDYQSLGEGLVNSRINSIYLGYHQLPYKLTSDVRCANFFASLKFNSSITSLKLDCICYADSAIKELVSVLEFTSITSLSLLSLGEFSSECNTLTDLILRLPATKITSLNLNGSKICGNIFYLASVLELTGITSLDLSDCTIFEGNHISEVQNKIDSNDDGSLNLRNRCLCFFSVCYLARQLCQGKFKKLNLSGNKMAYNSMKYLSQGLLGSQIVKLDLSSTSVDCCGVYHLAKVLRHTRVSSINLSHNEIACKGIKYLIDGLVGWPMESLDLSENLITDEGVQYLAQHLADTGISEINLCGNVIGNQTAYHLFNSVKQENRTVRNVHLDLMSYDLTCYMGLFKYPDCIVEICEPWSREDNVNHLLINDTYRKQGITKLVLKGENFSHLFGAFENISITEYEHRYSNRPIYDDLSSVEDMSPIFLNCNIAVMSVHYYNYERLMTQKNSILKVKAISLKLQKNSIRTHDLKNTFSIRYFRALISINIFYLDLSDIHETCYDIRILTEVLKDTKIISLNLRNNGMGARKAEIFANVLPLTRIIYVDLHENRIDYSAYVCLSKAARKSSVCWLSLGDNNIEEGLKENVDLSPYIVPRDFTPIEFQIRYLFRELVSLDSTGEQFEFIVPRDECVLTIGHYPRLIKYLPGYTIHIYDHFYLLTRRHDIQMMNKVNAFVEDMKHKFNMFIESRMVQLGERFGYDSFVVLVKECERLGLSDFVDWLLLHRSLYYVDDEQNFLHPLIYKLLHKYNFPLYNADIEPNKKQQIISYFEKHSNFECASEIVDLLSKLQE